MSRLIVAGLPRTGTTSVAKALEILGYDVIHYCPLTHSETLPELVNAFDGDKCLVSSHASLFYDIICPKQGTKYILIRRDEADWKLSIASFGLPAIKIANSLYPWYLRCLNVDNPNLLHYTLGDGWERLCSFLGKEIPNVEFPFENRGPNNWSI